MPGLKWERGPGIVRVVRVVLMDKVSREGSWNSGGGGEGVKV
jgi:hypothetical protein